LKKLFTIESVKMFLNTDFFQDEKDRSHLEWDAGSANTNKENGPDENDEVSIKSPLTNEREHKLAQQQQRLRNRQSRRQSRTLFSPNKSSVTVDESSAIEHVTLLMMEASPDPESTGSSISKKSVENYNPMLHDNPPVKRITDVKNICSIDGLLRFVNNPCPEDFIIQCSIIRNKAGLHSTYKLYLKDSSKVLMIARRRQTLKTSNYFISLDEESLAGKHSEKIVAKLRSNFLGTEFKL